jgi:peptidoglycan/LPS O-acetylase OafA/YrhL
LPPLIIGVILANITWSYSNFYGTPNRYIASLASIFYMANLLGSYMGNLSHVWSLSVEEHFYLLWPVFGAYYLFKKKLFNRVVHLIGMILLISVMRIYIFNMHEIPKIGPFTIDYYSFTFTRIDGILYGVILAMVLYELKPRLEVHLLKYKAILAAIIMVVFILISLFLDKANTQLNNFGFIFTNIFCTCTVLFAVIFNDTKLLSNRLMKWLGQRSYGIYVYHLPIFLVLEQFRHQNSVSNLILVTLFRFGLTFLVAELSFRFAEKPILKLKRHFEFKLI